MLRHCVKLILPRNLSEPATAPEIDATAQYCVELCKGQRTRTIGIPLVKERCRGLATREAKVLDPPGEFIPVDLPVVIDVPVAEEVDHSHRVLGQCNAQRVLRPLEAISDGFHLEHRFHGESIFFLAFHLCRILCFQLNLARAPNLQLFVELNATGNAKAQRLVKLLEIDVARPIEVDTIE